MEKAHFESLQLKKEGTLEKEKNNATIPTARGEKEDLVKCIVESSESFAIKEKLDKKAALLQEQIEKDEKQIWVMRNEILSSAGTSNTANIRYDKFGQSKALLTKINEDILSGLSSTQK